VQDQFFHANKLPAQCQYIANHKLHDPHSIETVFECKWFRVWLA